MNSWAVVLVLAAAALPQASAIYGGSTSGVNIGNFPYMVAWLDEYGDYFCSGSLISEQHVLTAASCFMDPTGYSLYTHRNAIAMVGSDTVDTTLGDYHYISEISIHPAFNPVNYAYHPADFIDLAVVRLTEPVQMGEGHPSEVVVLGSTYITPIINPGVKQMTAWGQTGSAAYSSTLQRLDVDFQEPSYCQQDATDFAPGEVSDFDGKFYWCVASSTSAGACTGDEGAPLIVYENGATADEKYQIGVFAGFAPGGECVTTTVSETLRNNFEKYTNTIYFGTWIQEHTNSILPWEYVQATVQGNAEDLKALWAIPDPDSASNSCAGSCGGEAQSGACWCDGACETHGDCCSDFSTHCNTLYQGAGVGSCEVSDACGYKADGCWCDTTCKFNGDCCSDYSAYCGVVGAGLDSCVGACGIQSGSCWCDDQCVDNGDCCLDYQVCSDQPDGTGSCFQNCGHSAGLCWCDVGCLEVGDCCPNYAQQCGSQGSCNGNCGKASGDCWCDMQCALNNDCCDDLTLYCPLVDVVSYLASR